MADNAGVRERNQGKKADNDTSDAPLGNGSIKVPQDQHAPSLLSSSVAATIFSPALITTLALIFGGCCSNVYTLESILKLSPATGTLVTFLQFLLTSIYTLRSQLTTKTTDENGIPASSFIPRFRKRLIPLSKWLVYTALFLTINILNNTAFNYRISVPLHIILRSAGPVTSMLVGYFVGGRRYTIRQITAVVLLFGGVALAAWSDAQSKSRPKLEHNDAGNGDNPMRNAAAALAAAKFSDQAPGFVLLFSALLVSAIMGLYTDELYNTYGRSVEVTNENLFYSHTLSLPFFALQSTALRTQYRTLTTNFSTNSAYKAQSKHADYVGLRLLEPILTFLPSSLASLIANVQQTDLQPFFLLFANAFTQIICITGVNRLSLQTTSLTVSIVLNIRKLASLLLSIWLFGNRLSNGVAMGAALVFLGGGLYGWKPRNTKTKTKTRSDENQRLKDKEL